jgi:hypothetical protein
MVHIKGYFLFLTLMGNYKFLFFLFCSTFYLFTFYLLKELISCSENPKTFIEVLDELKLQGKKKNPSVRRLPSAVRQRRLSANLVIRITFFPFNLDTSPFQV